jgi:hypothetical protein
MLDHLPMSTPDAAETFLVDADASEFASHGLERPEKGDGLLYLLVRDPHNGRTFIGQKLHQAFGRKDFERLANRRPRYSEASAHWQFSNSAPGPKLALDNHVA